MKTVAGLLVCSFVLAAQIAEDTWRFVHPGAGVIAGVEWTKIANSEFVRQLKRDFDGQAKTIRSEMDFIDDFESALMSAPAPGDPRQAKEALVVLRGRFNLAKLRQAAAAQKAHRQNYDGVEMYSIAKMSVAVLGERLLLIGDRASVTAALRDRDRITPPSSDLIARAREMAANANLFVVGSSASAELKGVRSVSLAIAVRARAELTASIEAVDENAASALMAAMPRQVLPLKIAAAGNMVTVTGSISAPDIRVAVQQFGQAMMAKVMGMPPGIAPSAGAAVLRPEPPLPPEKQVVRIYGLDEGVREVKLAPR